MIVNLRFIFTFLLVFVGLTGCRRDDPEVLAPAPRPRVTLTLNLSSPARILDAGTKATSGDLEATAAEKKIYNLNIFLFPKNPSPYVQEDRRHFYLPQDSLVPDLTDPTGTRYMPITLRDVCIGEYDAYIVANSGMGNLCAPPFGHDKPDNCPLTHASMLDLRTMYRDDTGLLMSGQIAGMQVLAAKQDVSLNLTFNMSRIKLNYSLATTEAQEMQVYTVKLQNAAFAAYPFNPHKALEADDYLSKEIWKGAPLSQNSYSKVVYVAPNPQGGVDIPAGGDPNLYRSAKYAPKQATYVYFHCKYRGAVLGYSAYLGDDRPSESSRIYFDILPNTFYDVNTVFNSIDPTDDRQCSFSIEPNQTPLRIGETSDFLYEGTTTPVTTTDLYRSGGKVAIEITFKMKTRNYFNDRFTLTCYSPNMDGTKFRAYINGSTEPAPNQAAMGFLFNLIEDTGQNAENNVNVRVVYEQSKAESSQTLYYEVKNRNGELLKTYTDPITIR